MATQPTSPALHTLTSSASQESLASRKTDISSNSSDMGEEDDPDRIDEGDVEEDPLQWHDDHWDELPWYQSFYIDTENDWNSSHIQSGKNSKSNESFYDNPITQRWQYKLARLSRADFPTLQFAPSRFVEVKIPLFRDEDTGEDYQIALHLWNRLVRVSCPKDPVPYKDLQQSRPLMRVVYQTPPAEEIMQHQGVEFPRFGIPIGTLAVRTTFRHPKHLPPIPDTEWTDYQVVLDAESEAMPLWIMCSRRTLQERHQAWQPYGGNPNLPIFRGLMEFEEYGYDTACILDSVHRLGERLSYQDACDLVQRTRAVVDPVVRHAPLAKMEELIGGPVPVGLHSSDV